MIDKYDCTSTVAAWGRLWLKEQILEEWENRSTFGHYTPNGHWTLLRIAYFFGDQSAFYDLTYTLIYDMSLQELKDNSSRLSGTLVGEMPSFVRGSFVPRLTLQRVDLELRDYRRHALRRARQHLQRNRGLPCSLAGQQAFKV